jgi:hypothetical protein
MQRDERACLNDIIEACAAIESALSDVNIAAYRADRLMRSAVVERWGDVAGGAYDPNAREFAVVARAASGLPA